MIRFLGSIVLIIIILPTKGLTQGSTCAQTLRLARATYEQGRLHELPTMLEDCLNKSEDGGGFTKQERVEAYRILTLAYIYLEEPNEADQAMLNLLGTDHFYQPNPDVDPAEFQALYRKFRNWPIFKVGVRVSGNFTFASTINANPLSSTSAGNGSYKTKFGFQVGAVFEKQLFPHPKFKNKILKKVSIAPEVTYTSRSFLYENSGVYDVDSVQNVNGTLESTYKQSWLDVNGLIQYKLKESNWSPYLTFGPGFSMLLTATNPTLYTSPNATVTGPDVETKGNYKPFMTSFIVGGGVKQRVGELFLQFDARFQYGFTSPIDPSKRFNSELNLDYSMSHNDWRQTSVFFGVTILYPRFKPKKLIK